MTKRKRLPAWTPFQLATTSVVSADNAALIDAAQAAGYVRGVIYVNSRYQVEVRPVPALRELPWKLWHLSIKRIDKDAIGSERFRDFQRIKNELVGDEHEGMELYPAESRLVDASNQYHLWVFEGQSPFDFGFGDRLLVEGHEGGPGQSRQLPFEPGTRPADTLTQAEAHAQAVASPLDPGKRAPSSGVDGEPSGPLSGAER